MKGFPVIWGVTEPADGIDVLRGRITHIVVPAVLRIFPCKGLHLLVPPGLGKDRCGRYGRKFPVTADDALKRNAIERLETVSVYQKKLRTDRQFPNRRNSRNCRQNRKLLQLKQKMAQKKNPLMTRKTQNSLQNQT